MLDQAVKLLKHNFAEISIQDVIRKTKRMSLPVDSLVVQFNMIVKDVMCKMSHSFVSHRRDVISFFGTPTIAIAKIWELILQNNDGNRKIVSNPEHLLWALHYMKQSPNITVLCKTIKKNSVKRSPTKKTVLKWLWFYVKEIRALEETVIVWDHQNKR